MAPLLFALLVLAQDAPAAPPSSDGPVATAVPRKQDVAPLPIQGGPVTPPSDDYGYVGWCYGAISGYVELYDKAMPEVIRIERAWPTPTTEENIAEVYPAQKKEALANIALFKRAIEAAEKASPTPIAPQGAAAIKKGRSVWTGAASVPKAQLAQFWMSWSPPSKCEETAKALEARSTLFGQALTYNTTAAAPPPPPPAPVVAKAEPAKAAPIAATPAPVATLAEPPATPAVVTASAPAAQAEPDVEITENATDAGVGYPPATPASTAPTAEAEGGSAIDALIPQPEAVPEEPVAAPTPDPEPVVAPTPAPAVETVQAPQVAPPAPVAETPASTDKPKRKRKPGLRETLRGKRAGD
jgi:hypothetical protein